MAIGLGATKGLLIYQMDGGVGVEGFYYYDGSAWLRLSSGATGSSWNLTGNGGTSPNTTDYIGTSDGQDFVVKTSNTQRMRYFSTGNIAIGTALVSPTAHVEIGGSGTAEVLSVNNTRTSGPASATASITTEGKTLSFSQNNNSVSILNPELPFTVGLASIVADAGSSSLLIQKKGVAPIFFATGDSSRMKIDPYGRVKIGPGITNSSANLEVTGPLNESVVVSSTGGANRVTSLSLQVDSRSLMFTQLGSGQALGVSPGLPSMGGLSIIESSNNSGGILINKHGNGPTGAIHLATNDSVRLRIDGNGYVGVGDMSSYTNTSTLDVHGSFARRTEVVTVANPFILTEQNSVIIYDTGSAHGDFILPPAVSCPGRIYTFKNMSSNTININSNSGAIFLFNNNIYNCWVVYNRKMIL